MISLHWQEKLNNIKQGYLNGNGFDYELKKWNFVEKELDRNFILFGELKQAFFNWYYYPHVERIRKYENIWGEFSYRKIKPLTRENIKAFHFSNLIEKYCCGGISSYLEIGAGSCCLIKRIREIHPNIDITIIDLPEVIEIQKTIISNVDFISAYEYENVINRRFDLIVQTNGFQEMLPFAIQSYMKFIKSHLLGAKGRFFCCNRKHTKMKDKDNCVYAIDFNEYGWDGLLAIYEKDDPYLGSNFKTKICKLG